MFGGYYYEREAVSPQFNPVQMGTLLSGRLNRNVPLPYTPYVQQTPQAPYLANFNPAYAMMGAGPDYPSITGLVTFTDIPGGVRVCADIAGLPTYKPATEGKQPIGPFGFHIHEKGLCEVGDPAKPFEACGGHWNPTNQPHGNHANR